ncbi:MAG: hypothetical protein IH948_01845 [Bacteroidetes bacterium]|nr:hypothetical protein [Bacteroidota bacterium]
MNKSVSCIVLLIVMSSITLCAQSKHGKSTKYPTYKGLVMAGYQGWFRADGDGSDRGWVHYGRDGKFDTEHNTIDFWPDVSDYEVTYKTSFKHANGKAAEVFSSLDKSTTKLHFKWMKEYGVDGVFMQRFFGVTRGYKDSNKSNDIILRNYKNNEWEDLSTIIITGNDLLYEAESNSFGI